MNSTALSLPPGKVTYTSPPEKRELTGQEIEAIILASAKANVRVLEVQGLRLEFGDSQPEKPTPTNPPASEPTSSTVTALTEKEHKKQSQESLELDEARTKEDRLAMMLIEDSLEYERLVCSGELQEDDEDEADDEALA